MKRLTSDAEKFFYKHAGYNYGRNETPEQGRIRCAISMAEAELYSELKDWRYEWEYDQDADLSWMTTEELQQEHEVLTCVLRDADGEVLASCGGIVDADRNYMRVMQAELASEAVAEIQHEHREATAVYSYCAL